MNEIIRKYQSIAVDVDIVIRCHNNLEILKKCIHSVITHTENFRLIIVDMNSQDGTREFLSEISDEWLFPYTISFQQENLGCSVGRNIGINLSRCSTTPNICFIDSDIIIEDDKWIEKMTALMTVDCLTVEAEVRLSDGYKMYAGGACHLVYRTLFDNIGTYDEKLFFQGDTDLWGRTVYAGYKIAFCSGTKILHNSHGTIIDVLPKKFADDMWAQSWSVLRSKWTDEFIERYIKKVNDDRQEATDLLNKL